VTLTIAEPVALYIYSFDTRFALLDPTLRVDSTLIFVTRSNFQLDYSGNQDGSDLRDVPDGVIRVTRGSLSANMGLRIEVSIPAGTKGTATNAQLTVSDIYDNATSTFIHYGAQFADYIKMSVSVNTLKGQEAQAQDCPCPPSVKEGKFELKVVEKNAVQRAKGLAAGKTR
jgi:hypothetical protein